MDIVTSPRLLREFVVLSIQCLVCLFECGFLMLALLLIVLMGGEPRKLKFIRLYLS